MAKKFYVVWVGRETGVFADWSYTKAQVDQFPKAKYKSFPTKTEAEAAFAAGWSAPNKSASNKSTSTKTKATSVGQSKSAVSSSKKYDVTVYCDGGCDPNPGKAASGVAVYIDNELAELWYGLFNPNGTNNTAELNALYQSLIIAQEQINKDKSVQILCDSKYSIDCVTNWAFNWKKKGWKRKVAGDIKNLEIIQQAHELYLSISQSVDVSHVRAHTGIEGNELADRMSIYGIDQQDPEFCRYTGSLNIKELLALREG